MSAVRLAGLEVELGGRLVLGPLGFELAERSWTLLVGPSGSGKSTLLRALAGLAVPRAGEVELFGRLASRGRTLLVPPEQRGVGLLFQGGGAALWPHLSVRATLEFVLACRKLPRAERARRTAELIELFELGGLEARRPGELSGGEAQRLGLARALAGDPRLLLLDEPLGPLDAELRRGLIERLAALHQRLPLTIVHVTHDPHEVEHVAGRCLRLEAGRLAGAEAAL